MSRWPSILLVLFFVLLTGGWLTWYLSYGFDTAPPANADLAGLSAPAEIRWDESGFATIEAASQADAFQALGYAQTMDRGAMMLLWRQTASGRLGEWFGGNLLGIDRFSRQLEMATLARASYDSLAAGDRALLDAFARGVNQALQTRQVRVSEDLAILGIHPEPWQPWHTLAVERLFAWLVNARPSADTLRALGSDGRAFFAADAQMRDWLHLHGFEHSLAWAVRDSSSTYLYGRQVHGSLAVPFFYEAVLQWPGGSVRGASLPGTPFFPVGKNEVRAWHFLPHGTATLERTVRDTTASAGPRFERLESTDGSEQIVSIRRINERLYFLPPPDTAAFRQPAFADSLSSEPDSLGGEVSAPSDTLASPPPPPAVPDTVWSVRWSGFQEGTDLSAWLALQSGTSEPFRLVRSGGIMLSQDGQWEVFGDPLVTVALENGVLVGNTRWARFVARDLDSALVAAAHPLDIRRLTTDYQSTWAASLAPALVASIDSIPGRNPGVEDALTYLQNWDYSYDRASIAATIFDTWLGVYRDSTGHLPEAVPPQDVYFEGFRRYQTLATAVGILRDRLGSDVKTWRWENLDPAGREFPVWSADSLLAEDVPSLDQRYAPVHLPNSGHPSTLFWGSSPVLPDGPHPSAWEAWTSTANWDALYMRRFFYRPSGFLSRYRISERVPPPVILQPSADPERTTRLRPQAAQ